MKLTLLQRIQLLQFVPKKGSYEKMVIAEDLQKKAGLTQDEIKDNEVSIMKNNRIHFKSNPDKEIEFTELEKEIIKNGLITLEKKEELDANLLPFYRLFILDKTS